jgi:glycosyltransferase involved in cell wall biosynthesis
MRILHVVPTYLPARRYGGPIVAVHGLAKALVARGHEVTVFTTTVDGDKTLNVPPVVTMDGVDVHYFASSFRRLYYSPAMRKALNQHQFDVVHSHAIWLWPGYAAGRAARKQSTPFVISPRGMLVPELIRRKNHLLKSLWLQLVEKRTFRHASVHFTSQLEGEEARQTGVPLPSSFVVPNGIDLVPRPPVLRDEQTLVFLGRINWKKGLDRIIVALPSLEARLIIAGNDEENLTPRLRELAEKHGVADRVEFVGPVYDDAKWQLLARATLFVLLSTSENFGNAVLEALMMETPVVLSKGVGLTEEVLRAGAGLVGVEGVNALLRDPARRAEMGRKGRALVESRFTWDRVAAEMEGAYERMKMVDG